MTAWAEYRKRPAGLVGLAGLATIALLAALAPVLTDRAALAVTDVTGPINSPPTRHYPLGTEESGRSVLLLTWWGARTSLFVGVSATLLAVGAGTVVGVLSGHFPGWGSAVLARFIDFFLVIPSLLLAIVLATVLARGTGTIVLAISATSWPLTARLVRAQTLTIEARPYVESSRALGGGHSHVIARHTLPGVFPVILATATLTMADSIIAESTLSFLGVGDPSASSWGLMLGAATGPARSPPGTGGTCSPPASPSWWWCWRSPPAGGHWRRPSTRCFVKP